MPRNQRLLLLALFLLLLVNVAGCAQQPNAQSTTPTAVASPTPIRLTPADLKKLRWIEGTWRGTGGGVPPFYERYKFENDTTMLMETLADETLSKVNEVSRYELKDGTFGHSEAGSGAVATAFDDNSISFSPTGKATNSFRFQRESDNSWKAILGWIGKDGAPKELVYVMERFPAK